MKSDKEVIKDFIRDTEIWITVMKNGPFSKEPCFVCGVRVGNMERLLRALKKLEL